VASPPPTDTYAAGVVIGGKYRLERKLGEGGMGSVWEAYHEQLDAKVAIKVIRSGSNRLELGPRLLLEARAAAKLGHPAIVRVFDVGQTTDGDPFIVMELLEGQSLNALLEREQRLSAPEAVRLLLPIADALRAAHAKGIVHRDIKPDNVFLVSDDSGVQPKLVDFGIAKFGPRQLDELGGATFSPREFDSQLTQQGAIVGSPDYMSPEQARGEEGIDQRADVWAFCVVLYESISGRSPFEGETYQLLSRAILDKAPPSLASLLAADAELSQIVETGMAKDRARRFQSMQELGEALARWLLTHGIFEDASGGAIEAKWVLRRSDSGHRRSRASMGSIPDSVATSPGLGGVPKASPERVSADAPTSLGPVVTGTNLRAPRRRLIVPLALALVAISALAARFLRSDPSTAGARVPPPGVAAPSSLAPASGPTQEPLAPSSASAAPEKLAKAPAAGAASPGSSSDRRRPRRPAKQGSAPAPAPKPGLDLLAPY